MGEGYARSALFNAKDAFVEVSSPIRGTDGIVEGGTFVLAFTSSGPKALFLPYHMNFISAGLSLHVTGAGVNDAIAAANRIDLLGTCNVATSGPPGPGPSEK